MYTLWNAILNTILLDLCGHQGKFKFLSEPNTTNIKNIHLKTVFLQLANFTVCPLLEPSEMICNKKDKILYQIKKTELQNSSINRAPLLTEHLPLSASVFCPGLSHFLNVLKALAKEKNNYQISLDELRRWFLSTLLNVLNSFNMCK